MISSLNALKRKDYLRFGSKAANLGGLISIGMDVPEGFALSFEFFEAFLKHNKIAYQPQQFLAFSSELRHQILAGQFSQQLSSLFSTSFGTIAAEGKMFAVRSSSLVEDIPVEAGDG